MTIRHFEIYDEPQLPSPATQYYSEAAAAQGHPRQVCETCAGSGVVVWRNWRAGEVDERCEDCGGTGIVTGECMCGSSAPLVPDLVRDDDCDGAILVCERCAVQCCHCDSEAAVSERTKMQHGHTVEQYCVDCWTRLNSLRLVAGE